MSATWKLIRRAAVAAALAGFATPATAQLFVTDPVFRLGPIEGSDPLVGLPLPGATPVEYRAHLLWNLRSGLNVAALQCQFSPYLRTVDTYNAVISNHARELAAAYTALEGYFRRVGGREGARRFDQYSTQTYNNFSTLQAQYAFCQTASRIGKEALAAPRGELARLASERMRELRDSLIPTPDRYAFDRSPLRLTPIAVSSRGRDCRSLPRSERRECERGR
jgi:hypothetical protein